MSRSSPSISQRKSEEIDVSYEIEMPFNSGSSKINLIDQNDTVKVIVSDIPAPAGFHRNYRQGENEDDVKRHAVARWVLEASAKVLERYDWDTSSHKARSRNRYLKDIYFECDKSEIDEAVMNAKSFLHELEKMVFHHSRKFGVEPRDAPSKLIDNE